MEQHESMGKGILIPTDVTDVHKMFRFARSKPDWRTKLGKAFTMAGYNLAIIGAGCLNPLWSYVFHCLCDPTSIKN